MRCAPLPTRWKASLLTIFGRCPPIKRCSTSSDEPPDDAVECGGSARPIRALLTRAPTLDGYGGGRLREQGQRMRAAQLARRCLRDHPRPEHDDVARTNIDI